VGSATPRRRAVAGFLGTGGFGAALAVEELLELFELLLEEL